MGPPPTPSVDSVSAFLLPISLAFSTPIRRITLACHGFSQAFLSVPGIAMLSVQSLSPATIRLDPPTIFPKKEMSPAVETRTCSFPIRSQRAAAISRSKSSNPCPSSLLRSCFQAPIILLEFIVLRSALHMVVCGLDRISLAQSTLQYRPNRRIRPPLVRSPSTSPFPVCPADSHTCEGFVLPNDEGSRARSRATSSRW